MLVKLSERSAQCPGAVFDFTHAGFGPIELGTGGTCHRQPLGGSAFFCKFLFGKAGFAGQFLPRRQLFLQRILEALNRPQFALEKCHGNHLAVHN